MRTQLGAVGGGTVGHERVLLELRLRPLDHDIAGEGGARGREAAAVLEELSAHFAPWTWMRARDGNDSARSRTRDGEAGRCDVHRGHLLPRSVVGPLIGHGGSLRSSRPTGQLVFRHVFVPPGNPGLTMLTSIRSTAGPPVIHAAPTSSRADTLPVHPRAGDRDHRQQLIEPGELSDTASWSARKAPGSTAAAGLAIAANSRGNEAARPMERNQFADRTAIKDDAEGLTS